MTKRRPPVSFADAVDRAVHRLGVAVAAGVVGLSERHVRRWSEPDTPDLPSLRQAVALDAAYLRAGGGEAPLLGVYQRQLEAAAADRADSAQLSRLTGVAAVQSGEALQALIAASQPDASFADRALAAREGEEAIKAMTAAVTRLGLAEPPPRPPPDG